MSSSYSINLFIVDNGVVQSWTWHSEWETTVPWAQEILSNLSIKMKSLGSPEGADYAIATPSRSFRWARSKIWDGRVMREWPELGKSQLCSPYKEGLSGKSWLIMFSGRWRSGDKGRFLCTCKKEDKSIKKLIIVDARKENGCNFQNVSFMRCCTENKKAPVLQCIRDAYSKSKLNRSLDCIMAL